LLISDVPVSAIQRARGRCTTAIISFKLHFSEYLLLLDQAPHTCMTVVGHSPSDLKFARAGS
jgi:hypothetical protein